MPNVQATKTLQKRCDAALESFHTYYVAIWGEERWHKSLFPALSFATRYCALINCYGDATEAMRMITGESEATNAAFQTSDGTTRFPLVLQKALGETFPQPSPLRSIDGHKNVLSHWNLDLASVLTAMVLQVRPGDQVLDLCASPGGKSIVLAQMLWDAEKIANSTHDIPSSRLHSNEFDQGRHRRLAANLQSYLPPKLFADNSIKLLRVDGSHKNAINELPSGKTGYDKILVDAPCSSERHIIHAFLKASSAGQISQEMSNWKSSHAKTLAKVQSALLMTAFKALKTGGRVVYATCSISSEENDDVVNKTLEALKRERKKASSSVAVNWDVVLDSSFEDDVVLAEMLKKMTEKTKHGHIALPDHPGGGHWGPLYFSVMRKV